MSPRTRKKKCKELKRNIIETQSQNDSIQIKNKKNDLRKKEISEKSFARKRYKKKKYWENLEQKKTEGSVEGSILPEVKKNLFGCLLC